MEKRLIVGARLGHWNVTWNVLLVRHLFRELGESSGWDHEWLTTAPMMRV